MPEDFGSVRIVLPSTHEFVETSRAERRMMAIPSGTIRVGGATSAAEEYAVLAGLELGKFRIEAAEEYRERVLRRKGSSVQQYVILTGLEQEKFRIEAAEDYAVLAGLKLGKFRIVEDREASPLPDAAAQRAMRGPVDEKLEVHVHLAPDEGAVLLLEQDGVYAWKTDYVERSPVTPATFRREGILISASRTVMFEVAFDPQPGTAETRSLKSILFGDIRTIVLKFARRAVGVIADYLEEDIHRGLVHMYGDSVTDWVDINDLGELDVATKDAPHLLLFVHGTLSSTRGSFGALADSPWGKKFMVAALTQYDAVIGFDHSTLRDDPKTNATELLRLLREVPWKQPPRIDVVTFSRGGLVYRALVEGLPSSGFAPRFERSIFVGVPNAGTHLADPQNWSELVDLYTNLSVALFRLLGTFPQAKSALMNFVEAIAILGGLVKALASAVAEGDSVPGLASMNPDGPFIEKLNEVSPDAPTIAGTYYCYVTSNFEADAKGAPPKEIPPRLWMHLANGFVDRLLKSATNDLIVDTKSVPQIDIAAGKYMKDSYEFPANSYCYHTNYFTRPEDVDSLTTWLGKVVANLPG